MPQDLESDSIDDTAKITTNIKIGDLIEIGNHRLLCGDSTKKEDVERLMNGKKADMVLTDPPYGMKLDTDYSSMQGSLGRKAGTRGKSYDKVIGDNDDFKSELITCIFDNFGYVKEIFLFGADYFAELINNKNEGSWQVWDKRKESQADAFGSEFELIWSKQPHKRRLLRHDWFGFLSSQNTKEAQNRVHPTQKPTSLLNDIMNQWGNKNDIVSDLFLGSGSTMVACQTLDRICYGMELEPLYCQVIINRMRKNFPELEIKVNGQIYAE